MKIINNFKPIAYSQKTMSPSKLDNDDKEVVKELVSMVESADGLNLGIKFEEKLKNLINKANKRAADVKLNTSEHVKSFIPPVQVRYRNQEDEIQEQERERTRERV